MADLHAFLTAAIVGNTFRGVEAVKLRELIAHVAVESIVRDTDGDEDRLMMLMEAGL